MTEENYEENSLMQRFTDEEIKEQLSTPLDLFVNKTLNVLTVKFLYSVITKNDSQNLNWHMERHPNLRNYLNKSNCNHIYVVSPMKIPN